MRNLAVWLVGITFSVTVWVLLVWALVGWAGCTASMPC